ncbi:hypothetical protein [Treponema sp. Marseille-Q4130]|nr:hypothetical protein [Treponema sp. Marseille-Q4130]
MSEAPPSTKGACGAPEPLSFEQLVKTSAAANNKAPAAVIGIFF